MTIFLSLLVFNLGFLAGAWWATKVADQRTRVVPRLPEAPNRLRRLPRRIATATRPFSTRNTVTSLN